MPNFDACGAEFTQNAFTKYPHFIYNGSVRGIVTDNRSPLITLHGCETLCGKGTEYYVWKDAANTISTWVLPILGLIVQAPWESNQAWQTTLMFFRWMGSPIAALSYILWNIKISSKCALMIDMATKFDEYPSEDSEFGRMRDGIYILSVMNQYDLKPALPPIEAEQLLRVVLFSNLLPLKDAQSERESLINRRRVLAQELREGRKKGVIPNFISFLWFVFALGLSIELAFDEIGGNAVAHNLALGLLVSWLPVMVVASTVDRNQTSADAVREKLNDLVNDVRLSLIDEACYERYREAIKATDDDFEWTRALFNGQVFDGNFFPEFAGQGRSHFHYGAAHPILYGLETKSHADFGARTRFMARYGRNWLQHSQIIHNMVNRGTQNRNVAGLKMFDPRMVWQVFSAFIIVAASGFGAFVISWFTPTVGLSCRSGGYLIYTVIALFLMCAETFIWWQTHETTHTHHDPIRRISSKLERRLTATDSFHVGSKWHKVVTYLHSSAFRDIAKNLLLRPIEACNATWLIYIIFAQTFGSYQTCACMSSNWSWGGGYIDFQVAEFYGAGGVLVYWTAGTATSCIALLAGMIYIIHEYCTQSHLSTEEYGRAMQGLRITRRYKKHTRFVRWIPDVTIRLGKRFGALFGIGSMSRGEPERKSLIWTVNYTERISVDPFGTGEEP